MKHRAALSAISFFTLFASLVGVVSGQDAESCSVCHAGYYEEWLQSPHSRAWKGPEFKAQMEAFGSPGFCGRCHAPQAVWSQVDKRTDAQTLDLAAEAQPQDYVPALAGKAELREERPEEGVSCGSCHLVSVLWRSGATVAFLGPYHTEEGHGGKQFEAFSSLQFCGACHGRPEPDYLPSGLGRAGGYYHSQTRASEFGSDRKACAQCHMPSREGKLVDLGVFDELPPRTRHEHTFIGTRHDRLAEALDLTWQIQEGKPTLTITNSGLGHPPKMSAGTEYRMAVSKVVGGRAVETQEVDLGDVQRLAPGAAATIPLPLAAETGDKIRVELFRKSSSGFEQKILSRDL